MQDFKKNKKRINNQQTGPVANKVDVDEIKLEAHMDEDLNRGCGFKPQHNPCKPPQNHCECECECECECDCNNNHDHDKHHHCKPCQNINENCVDNICANLECCNPITPPRFSTANAIPFAIETNRVFDTMEFQTFTDAVAPGGEQLVFDYDVVEVNGSVPRGGQVNVTIEQVCMNYSAIVIDTGTTTLEDFDIQPLDSRVGENCETNFEYAVCGRRNVTCCEQGKGKCVVYRQKGLNITVEDLVLELRGKCGCTEIVALAHPAIQCPGGHITRCCDVQFMFNTLTAPIALPADGRSVTLRQNFNTNLTVDCIGKAILRCICNECGESLFELCIPNDIDLIMCLQSVVSTLINEQIVVLGAPNPIQPRIVDTFNKVCDFRTCGERSNTASMENNQNNHHNKGGCNC